MLAICSLFRRSGKFTNSQFAIRNPKSEIFRLQLKLEMKFNHRSRDRHLLEWYFTRVAKVSDPGVGRIRGNPSLNVADLISPDKPI